MSEKYGKDWIIKEIAVRASFTQGDAREMFNAFEEIVQEMVASHDELLVGGLFHIYCHEIKEHDGFNLATKKEEHRDTTYRLTIKPSTTLKKIAKNGNTSSFDE
jgi:nucleoid DNA-binding protein